MTPYVIPFFIPHDGCPHCCVFCNQHSITSVAADDVLTAEDIQAEIRQRLKQVRGGREVQVAFYGGSFTGLARERQQELLAAVAPFIDDGRVDLIRLSTRPDYIDLETVMFLRSCHVQIVEIGVQSLDDKVLAASGRGHSAAQVEEAFRWLRQAGLTVGGQLMVGLPAESTISVLNSAEKLARLKPDMIRLYPALVLRGSSLARIYQKGDYRPLSMNRAVALCAMVMSIFVRQRIPVVRIGLQPSLALEREILAGPYHPAMGELVQSRLLFNKVRALLSRAGQGRGMELCFAAADQSVFRGKGNMNVQRLTKLGLLDDVTIRFDPDQARQSFCYQKNN